MTLSDAYRLLPLRARAVLARARLVREALDPRRSADEQELARRCAFVLPRGPQVYAREVVAAMGPKARAKWMRRATAR